MLTTLDAVKAELYAVGTVIPDDAKIIGYIRTVTARILRLGGLFEPQYDTKYFTPFRTNTNYWNGALELVNPEGQQYLLAGGSDTPAIVRSGQTLVWNTDVFPYPQALNPVTPIRVLRLSDQNGQIFQTWYPHSIPPIFETINITAFWGWRQYYGTQGWLSSLQTVLDNPLTSTATTVTVTNVGAVDSLDRTPVFSPGNLIRIDNEMLLVLATNSTTNTLAVQRGVNGTTAIQHNMGTSIIIWEPEEQIQGVATRQAALLYQRRGAFDQMRIEGIATTLYPRDLIAELYDVMQEYANQ